MQAYILWEGPKKLVGGGGGQCPPPGPSGSAAPENGYFVNPKMTLSNTLSYMSICLSYWEFCHFEAREVTPSHSKRLFRESQNDSVTCEMRNR